MATESAVPASTIENSELVSDLSRDEKIMAQKDAIDDEIKRTTKLIADLTDIKILETEFANDEAFLEKVKNLSPKFDQFRRIRPDGNCFFRSVAFAYFEYLLNDRSEYERFRETIIPTKEKLVEAGFPAFSSEDFFDNFMDTVDKLQPKPSKVAKLSDDANPPVESGEGMSLEDLLEIFNDQGTSDYLVVFLRLLTSMQIKSNAEFYQNFMVDGQTVQEFCSLEVEPMYRESDHIHITALSELTGITIQVIYLDRGNMKEASIHTFPENCQKPLVHLLYRPGHYDIVYPRK